MYEHVDYNLHEKLLLRGVAVWVISLVLSQVDVL